MSQNDFEVDRVELLIEVFDALSMSGHDGDANSEHIRRIDEFLNSHPDAAIATALSEARGIMNRREGRDPLVLALEPEGGVPGVLEAIRSMLPPSPTYVYHGTASKHLVSIAAMGLRPAHSRTHWSSIVDGEHLASGVFFTSGWRAASGWAFAASHTLKGEPRKDTLSAVLRLRADGLILERDLRARQSGCLVVAGSVDAAQADVLVGDVRGFPDWQPLSHWLARQPQGGVSGSRRKRSRNPS